MLIVVLRLTLSTAFWTMVKLFNTWDLMADRKSWNRVYSYSNSKVYLPYPIPTCIPPLTLVLVCWLQKINQVNWKYFGFSTAQFAPIVVIIYFWSVGTGINLLGRCSFLAVRLPKLCIPTLQHTDRESQGLLPDRQTAPSCLSCPSSWFRSILPALVPNIRL